MAAAPKTFQFKLVLLGDSAVGKSSLVLRFVRGQFFEYQEATIGGEFRCGGVARRAHPTVDVTESARGRRGARWEAYVWAHTLLFAAAFLTQTVALNDTTVKFGDPPAPPPTTHHLSHLLQGRVVRSWWGRHYFAGGRCKPRWPQLQRDSNFLTRVS